LQDNVKVFPSLSEESVKVINLRGGARVAVQQEAALDVGLTEAVAHHLVGDGVWNEVASSMYFIASIPSLVRLVTFARKISPVEMATTSRSPEISSACVPFPEPGGPIISFSRLCPLKR
jgi:hypothetical protein